MCFSFHSPPSWPAAAKLKGSAQNSASETVGTTIQPWEASALSSCLCPQFCKTNSQHQEKPAKRKGRRSYTMEAMPSWALPVATFTESFLFTMGFERRAYNKHLQIKITCAMLYKCPFIGSQILSCFIIRLLIGTILSLALMARSLVEISN